MSNKSNTPLLDSLLAMDDLELALYRLSLLESFELFARFCFATRTSGKVKMSIEPHHKIICEAIDKIINRDIHKLVVSLPPRHSKTEFFNIMLGCRALAEGINGAESLQTSYANSLVLKCSSDIKEITQSKEFRTVFGTTWKRGTKEDWETTRGSVLHSRSTGGQITGFNCGSTDSSETRFSGFLVMDDPSKASASLYPAQLKAATDLYDGSISNRPNNAEVPQVLIMQRLAKSDLAGHLLGGHAPVKAWTYLNIPALVDESTGSAEWYEGQMKDMDHRVKPYLYSFDIPELHKRNLRDEYKTTSQESVKELANNHTLEEFIDILLPERLTSPYAAIWAARKSVSELEDIRDTSDMIFSSQFMGSPIALSGGIFKPEWIEYVYDDINPRYVKDFRILVDCANTTNDSSDSSVFTAAIRYHETGKRPEVRIIEVVKDKYEFPELCTEFKKFYKRMEALANSQGWVSRLEGAWVEDKANGRPLLDQFSRDREVKVHAVSRSIGKVIRAISCCPALKNGQVLLPRADSEWKQDLKKEVVEFSYNDNHDNDDICDTLFDAIKFLIIEVGDLTEEDNGFSALVGLGYI